MDSFKVTVGYIRFLPVIVPSALLLLLLILLGHLQLLPDGLLPQALHQVPLCHLFLVVVAEISVGTLIMSATFKWISDLTVTLLLALLQNTTEPSYSCPSSLYTARTWSPTCEVEESNDGTLVNSTDGLKMFR